MMWIFGYGSLLWRPNFPYKQKVVGHVKGYVRRFWEGSTRYRGIPGKPGRVVTLVQEPEGCVWGIAYQISAEDKRYAQEYLYTREMGYKTETVNFWPKHEDHNSDPFKVTTYFSTSGCADYLGPASTEDIARQISGAAGLGGKNAEYLFNLAEAMRTIAPEAEDLHLFELEQVVKQMTTK